MAKGILQFLTQALLVSSSLAFTAREDGMTRHSKTPVPINARQWTMFNKYANYVSSAVLQCETGPGGAQMVKYLNVENTTTNAGLFRNDIDKEFVLAFPGTDGMEDEKLDGQEKKVPFRTLGVEFKDCKYCHVHKGFFTAWNSFAYLADKTIKEEMAGYDDYHLVLTGHSLGAAIASLGTASLKGAGHKIKRTVTFGEPRVGGPRYAIHIDKIMGADMENAGHYHRVTHANDDVPQLPPISEGYRHSRTEYWETSLNIEDQAETVRCFGQEPTNCNNGANVENIIGDPHQFYGGVEIGAQCGY